MQFLANTTILYVVCSISYLLLLLRALLDVRPSLTVAAAAAALPPRGGGGVGARGGAALGPLPAAVLLLLLLLLLLALRLRRDAHVVVERELAALQHLRPRVAVVGHGAGAARLHLLAEAPGRKGKIGSIWKRSRSQAIVNDEHIEVIIYLMLLDIFYKNETALQCWSFNFFGGKPNSTFLTKVVTR